MTDDYTAQAIQAIRDDATAPLKARIAELEAELAKSGNWETEDQQHEVLLGHPLWSNPVVYDECDALGGVEAIACRVRREMDADELEPGPVYTRRITRDFRKETTL